MTQAIDKALFNQNKRLIKSKMAQESVCPYCNSIMLKDTTSPYNLVSIDHITAYSKGGDDSLENLIPCCANCNTKKGNTETSAMFKLNNPRILSNNEYELLNDYTTVSVRIDYLKSIKDLITSGELPKAIQLSKECETKTSSKSFFSKLTSALKNNTNPDYVIKEVIVRLKAELDKMTNLTESTQHIKFSIYQLSKD